MSKKCLGISVSNDQNALKISTGIAWLDIEIINEKYHSI